MQVSIVKFSKIDLGNRIDAEYFEPFYLSNEKILTNLNSKKLSMYCDITGSAFYPAATHLYEIGEVPFVRCVDCINYPIITPNQNDSFERIPHHFVDEHNNIKVLKNNDIVITKVGTPCFASVIDGIEKVALSRTVLGLYNIKNINPFFLTIFLRSKYGFQQLWRERELTIQYQLTLKRVGNISIYQPQNSELEDLIAKVFIWHQSINSQAIKLYIQAEHLLFSELGLADWQPKHQLSFVKNFSDTHQVERIDAEYFQPKYDEIVDAITTYKGGWDMLGNLVKIKKSIEPGSDAYQESGVPFVRVSNLSKHEITNNNQQYISEELYQDLIEYQPKQNEILLSKDATPGIAFHLKEKPDRMIPSGGILRLTVRNRERPSEEYLTLVLNSTLVQQQILRDAGGSIIKHWRLDQVKNTLIPILGKEKQKEIKSKIEVSFDCRKKSKLLLEIAKQGVEMAIEQDEETAKEWIKMQIQDLEINLNDEE